MVQLGREKKTRLLPGWWSTVCMFEMFLTSLSNCMAHLTIINQVYGLYSMHRVETMSHPRPCHCQANSPQALVWKGTSPANLRFALKSLWSFGGIWKTKQPMQNQHNPTLQNHRFPGFPWKESYSTGVAHHVIFLKSSQAVEQKPYHPREKKEAMIRQWWQWCEWII